MRDIVISSEKLKLGAWPASIDSTYLGNAWKVAQRKLELGENLFDESLCVGLNLGSHDRRSLERQEKTVARMPVALRFHDWQGGVKSTTRSVLSGTIP